MVLNVFVVLNFLVFPLLSQAQQGDLLEKSFSGSSKEATPLAAKTDIQNQAAQKVSEEVIKEFIGDERFNKNKTAILNKIIKNSARYIPFSKPSNMVQAADEFKMTVSLKISVSDLRQMLQENQLLSESDTIPVVLPVVSLVDNVHGRSFRWWVTADKGNQGFLFKQGRALEEALRNSFQGKNFYVIKPLDAGLGANVPAQFQSEHIAGEDAQFFSHMFNAPVLIEGQLTMSKEDKDGTHNIEMRLTAVQVSNSRPIADVSRKFTTESGPFEISIEKKMHEVLDGAANDLASQVLEASQRGSLGTSVIRLTIQGNPGLPFLENLKEKIRSQITQVKNIRERLVASDSVSYEVDTSSSAADLAQKVEALDFNGAKLSKVTVDGEQLVFKYTK